MRKKMQLYVWTDFSSDYTSGLAFALAKSQTEAEALVRAHYGFTPSDWGTLAVHDLKTPFAQAVSGGG
jgi:hypothetical protein